MPNALMGLDGTLSNIRGPLSTVGTCATHRTQWVQESLIRINPLDVLYCMAPLYFQDQIGTRANGRHLTLRDERCTIFVDVKRF